MLTGESFVRALPFSHVKSAKANGSGFFPVVSVVHGDWTPAVGAAIRRASTGTDSSRDFYDTPPAFSRGARIRIRSLWRMEPNDADTARVYAFANQLAALPLAAWYEIGDAARRAEATARAATAEAILEAIIADGNLQLEQWEARDLITTAAHLVSRH